MSTTASRPSGTSGRIHPAHGQRGVVLVITLVMLVLLTLIGIVGMQDTNLQERMAGNHWDRNMAFQGAEAGLRVGESWLEGPPATPGTGVARRAAAEDHDELTAIAYWDGSDKEPAVEDAVAEYATLADLAEKAHLDSDAAPLFHIEPPSFVRQPGDINLNQAELECQRIFPVTARSVGGTDNSVVVLRSTYIPRQSGVVICPIEE